MLLCDDEERDYGNEEKAASFAAECAALGIETNIWTVDEPEWMERLQKMGVTSIITDKPDLACTVLLGK